MSSQRYHSELEEQIKAREEKHSAKSSQPIMDWFKLFLHIMNVEKLTSQLRKILKTIIKDDVFSEEMIYENLPERNSRWVQWNKKRIRREFRVYVQIAGFQIKKSMLDLGLNVNIFPKKTWEALGNPKLVYFLIQLHMKNQYDILPCWQTRIH